MRVISAGDIDDTLADPEALPYFRRKFEDFDRYLKVAWTFTPVRTFFIPFGAGISTNGRRPYISYDVQVIIRNIDCSPALVRHETTEWGLREYCGIGVDYEADPAGHRIANRVEAELVERLLSLPLYEAWDLYSEVIDPQVVTAERMKFEEKPIPRDLAMYPYDEEMQTKLREAMRNSRSQEEWERLNGTD